MSSTKLIIDLAIEYIEYQYPNISNDSYRKFYNKGCCRIVCIVCAEFLGIKNRPDFPTSFLWFLTSCKKCKRLLEYPKYDIFWHVIEWVLTRKLSSIETFEEYDKIYLLYSCLNTCLNNLTNHPDKVGRMICILIKEITDFPIELII